MRYIKNIFILLPIILTVSCITQTDKKNKQEAINLNDQAIKLMTENPDSALILLDKAIEIDNSNYIFHSNKANIFIARKDYARAISSVEKAVEVKPDLAESVMFLGMLYDRNNQNEKAKKQYEKAVILYDNRIEKHDQYEQSNRMNRAVTLIFLGQVEQGKNELKKLLSDNPDDMTLQHFQDFDKEMYLNEILGKQ
jgi:Tfp pilus assembly protein PilF